jgi:hypothetical protein
VDCGEFICCTTEGGNFVEGIRCEIGTVNVQRKNINKSVLDTVIELVGSREETRRDMDYRESDKGRMNERIGRVLTA